MFEMVLVNSPELATIKDDPHTFSSHTKKAKDSSVVFQNLGGDATLVVPVALDPSASYAHIAAFVRTAPVEQVKTFWKHVGVAMSKAVVSTDQPVWLSTSGLGVSWLHVRLDMRPKYYQYGPFKKFPYQPAEEDL
jgi:hypothetical protein